MSTVRGIMAFFDNVLPDSRRYYQQQKTSDICVFFCITHFCVRLIPKMGRTINCSRTLIAFTLFAWSLLSACWRALISCDEYSPLCTSAITSPANYNSAARSTGDRYKAPLPHLSDYPTPFHTNCVRHRHHPLLAICFVHVTLKISQTVSWNFHRRYFEYKASFNHWLFIRLCKNFFQNHPYIFQLFLIVVSHLFFFQYS